ncbi:hypothetical protein J8281_06665 [Aquimarina sp. U1-2]|uniref:nucleoside-triphosphatase n=1 Tax=Aquimarina sp. U1-2 TaxID=2823141 RepID=UPI001AECC929|nr:nucleoside-triphosphatase [Aquimarina sp. U1-2]MBP2831866.1 hypothetical protein [Aquimarina sp. U1-2]
MDKVGSKNNIVIFSRPIRTGKTTELLEWSKNRSEIGGFATPDINGLRHLRFLDDNRLIPFEVGVKAINRVSRKSTLSVGKFEFYQDAFDQAKNRIKEAEYVAHQWFVVDEIGKLELNDKGFAPEVCELISKYKRRELSGNLLLVVRQELLDLVIYKYALTNFCIVKSLMY